MTSPPIYDTLDFALRYAKKGWPIFPVWDRAPTSLEARMNSAGNLTTYTGPVCGCMERSKACKPCKHPIGMYTPKGVKNATTDPSTIKTWWADYARETKGRQPNIGLAAGKSWWALDVDGEEGADTLARLELTYEFLPNTLEARTGSGGRHLLFLLDPNRPDVGNLVKFQPGLDTRSDGGAIIAAPSIHISGGRYLWTSPPGTRIMPAPAWLYDLIAPHRKPGNSSRIMSEEELAAQREGADPDQIRYALTALEREREAVLEAATGAKNNTLNRAAFNLGQIVGGGFLDEHEVFEILMEAASEIGFGLEESEDVVRRGMRDGARKPRRIKPSIGWSKPLTVAEADFDEVVS
ncbi:MAG: bifunctional DNA primase/polymerase [Rhodospirillaceae bacterium]